MWANREGLFGKEVVAIDGSKFKAVNSKARSYTPKKLERMIEREREKVERYMADLEEADNEDAGDGEKQLSGKELREKIARMKKYLERHKMVLEGMKERGEKQHAETDPDARMMKTTKGKEVSYNVQIAVDEKHKLIVDVEATNEIADQGLLAQMAVKAKEVLEVEHLVVVADGGYFSNEAIRECEESGITSFVPVPKLGNARHKGIYPREVFNYDESRDTYLCPAGEEMTVVSRTSAKGRYTKDYKVYGTSECKGCPLRQQCTTSKHGRKIKRWVHYKVFERLQARIRNQPEMLRKRKGIVEHPFGTIKVSMNHERLLTKGLSNVGTEMAFAAISYNLRRVLSVLGIKMMMQRFQHELARK